MKIEIKKTKLKDGCAIVDYVKTDHDGKQTSVSEELPYLVHPDLKNAMTSLVPHLAKICDLREGDAIGEDITDCHSESFAYIEVTAFVVSGNDDESRGVVLIGTKKIGNKKLNLVSPFTKFQDEFEPYEFESELYHAVKLAQEEAKAYVFEGKHVAKQLEFSFDGHEDDLE